MSSSKRTSTVLAELRPARLATVAFALAVSGCSADVTRFDSPGFSLTENSDRPAGPPPPSSQPYAQAPQPAPRGLTGEPLPPPERTAHLPPPPGSYDRSVPRLPPPGPQPQADRRAPPVQRAAASGEMVEVQPGDTLYGLARRHNVPVSTLIEVNNLGSNGNIKPGQKLALPAASNSPAEPTPGRPAAPRIPVAKASTPPPQPGWDSLHTMRTGESLYGIARQHNVTLEELQRVNGITDPARVRIGAKLRVPGAAEPQPEPQRAAYNNTPAGTDPLSSTPQQGTPSLRVLNGQRKASIETRANDAEPTAALPADPAGGARFRWPARGKVIASFGKRPDGTHNDGVNLAVPMGSDIVAAEGGRVAYAGNDIQAYGNLILIRHDNGWVSAYAHADKILVQRDDVVRRGQVIAKAGRTGTVDQPQVHFELRQGAKPVDPLPHMER